MNKDVPLIVPEVIFTLDTFTTVFLEGISVPTPCLANSVSILAGSPIESPCLIAAKSAWFLATLPGAGVTLPEFAESGDISPSILLVGTSPPFSDIFFS